VVLDVGVERAAFREALAARGVQTSVHYPPAHRLTAHARAVDLPITEAYGERAVTLPLFATMTIGQQDAVVDAVRAAVGPARAVTGARSPGT
jgi:dTDP-4-amino-4,6-dideoxygalactose transaminase